MIKSDVDDGCIIHSNKDQACFQLLARLQIPVIAPPSFLQAWCHDPAQFVVEHLLAHQVAQAG